jgi:hypothetical protein
MLAMLALTGCRVPGGSADDFGDFDRHPAVRTISATLHVTLELEEGAPVELEGIMVAELPRLYRLQLWKLRAPVLDITRTRRGTWVLNRLAEEELADARMLQHTDFKEGIALMVSGFRMASRLHARSGADQSCVRHRTGVGLVECCPDGGSVTCTLSRKRGGTLATAMFTGFRRIGPSEWPTDVSLDGEAGKLRLVFEEIEINQPLAASAFVPPRQARKIR